MAKSCKHCQQPTKNKSDFCCAGCEAAFGLINDLGLGNYYQTRIIVADEKTLIPDEASLEVSMTRFVTKNDEGNYSLHLFVQGIHCASCVWLIESALAKQEGIVKARMNMSTRRLALEWEGKKERGDDYIKLVQSMGYKLMPFNPNTLETTDDAEQKFLLRCLGVAGFAAGNLMMLSIGLWSSTGDIMGMATRDFLHLISALIGIPTALYAGRPFMKSALQALKHRHTNMDVPISLAIMLTLGMSLYELSQSGEHVFFDSIVMLIFFLLIGRYLDVKAKGKARSAAQNLLQLMAGSATVLEEGKQRIIPVSEVEAGMVVLVSSGERITIDGEIIAGESEIDTSIITGESLPRAMIIGDNVYTGMINIGDSLKVQVSAAGTNSVLAEIIRLMEVAETGKANYVRLADRAAALYTPIVHVLGALTFLGWLFWGGVVWQEALLIATTVLIITCPCALGLAVPVVQIVASGRLLRKGILLKTGVALEKLDKVSHVVFDKTGTLTQGNLTLVNGIEIAQEDMRLAASMAVHSKHPLSKAIVAHYRGDLDDVQVEELAGKGLKTADCQLGKRSWVEVDEEKHPPSCDVELWLKKEDGVRILFRFSDSIREDAREVIEGLKAQHVKVTLLSGDREMVVDDVAQLLNITEAKSEMTPLQKAEFVEQAMQQGEHILFVGDGLNDAPALAKADVSMSPSTAADISQNVADIVFQGQKLAPVLEALLSAKKSTTLVKQNFMLAIAYNLIAIPLAVMGYVTPLIAAVAMSASSLIVISNSMRLRGK